MHGKNFRVRNQFDLLVGIFDSVMKSVRIGQTMWAIKTSNWRYPRQG